MVAQQGSSLLVDAGLNFKFILSEASKYTDNINYKAMHIGAYYRLHDAFFVAFKFDVADISASVAYDVNISGLTPASHSVGGFEIMLAYHGFFGAHAQSKRMGTRFMDTRKW